MFGLVCLAVGFVFLPAAVALEVSQDLLVAGVALDVAVAIDHPTQDNWVTVGGDALALAGGYVVGKVIIGPALGALGREIGPIKATTSTGSTRNAGEFEKTVRATVSQNMSFKLTFRRANTYSLFLIPRFPNMYWASLSPPADSTT